MEQQKPHPVLQALHTVYQAARMAQLNAESHEIVVKSARFLEQFFGECVKKAEEEKTKTEAEVPT